MGVTLESLGGWPAVLGRLFAREDLSAPEAEAVLDVILLGEATPAQIAAFAAALRTKGETAEEMIGAVRSMRAHSERIELGTGLVDTCGTGGDRSGSINVSSMAAVVVAAAGARVCKHGGRAASSMAGSADVFEALGVAIELGPVGVARCVEETGIGFCFAPRFHPAMRFAAPVRRELGVATLFNFLGPLANPAAASRQLVGVGDSSMAERVLSVLEANSAEHAMVVFGHDGLDELSTVAPSTLLETVRRSDGSYERSTAEVNATDFGIAPASAEELRGGSPETNARLVRAVFSGEVGPRREFVALNAGAALKVAGLTGSLAD
ncbi:MAG: anthranilate phosphoribosyltransferase, partial [Acidimicrobiales bacterium]